MNGIVTKLLGSSPWTSILGYLLAALAIAVPIIQGDGFDIKKDWPNLIFAILSALMGRKGKDDNGVKATEGFAMKQAIFTPTAKEEEEEVVVEEEPVIVNEKVAQAVKASLPKTIKKKTTGKNTHLNT